MKIQKAIAITQLHYLVKQYFQCADTYFYLIDLASQLPEEERYKINSLNKYSNKILYELIIIGLNIQNLITNLKLKY